MHKYTILFLVLCAVVAASAVPAKKNALRKSAKIVRYATAKNAKLARAPIRRSGKFQIIAQGKSEAKINFEPHHFAHIPHVELPHHVAEADFIPAVEVAVDEELADEIPEVLIEAEFEQDVPEADVTVIDAEQPIVERAFINADEDSVEETEDEYVSAHTKSTGAGGNYFSTSFGKAKGGSIAIGNSYSAGKKGQATSHATSYGTH